MKVIEQNGNWVCYANSNVMDLPKIDELLLQISNFPKVLKNDRRSLVVRGDVAGCDIVAKQPRDKNRRAWAQFLSRFRDSEAVATFKALNKFISQDIASVLPVCVLEQRIGGKVVDSWLLYEFREGVASGRDQLEQVIGFLKKLHSLGYRHEDPNFGNFLIAKDGAMFLIDCKGKSKGGYFREYYDFVLLAQRNVGVEMADIDAQIRVKKYKVGYWLARVYIAYISTRTSLKQRLKRRKSKQDIE